MRSLQNHVEHTQAHTMDELADPRHPITISDRVSDVITESYYTPPPISKTADPWTAWKTKMLFRRRDARKPIPKRPMSPLDDVALGRVKLEKQFFRQNIVNRTFSQTAFGGIEVEGSRRPGSRGSTSGGPVSKMVELQVSIRFCRYSGPRVNYIMSVGFSSSPTGCVYNPSTVMSQTDVHTQHR